MHVLFLRADDIYGQFCRKWVKFIAFVQTCKMITFMSISHRFSLLVVSPSYLTLKKYQWSISNNIFFTNTFIFQIVKPSQIYAWKKLENCFNTFIHYTCKKKRIVELLNMKPLNHNYIKTFDMPPLDFENFRCQAECHAILCLSWKF